MDEINDFFDFGVPFKRETVGARIGPRKVSNDTDSIEVKTFNPKKRDEHEMEYVSKYQKAEMDKIMKTFSINPHEMDDLVGVPGPSTSSATSVATGGLFNASDLDSIMETDSNYNTDIQIPRIDDVYDRYNFNYTPCDLPIIECKEEIIDAISDNPVIVLQGSTGCGKTTQVPQMILDNAQRNKDYCNIIVTQPRRIAARSIAKRVCDERGWELGLLVGYQVGLSVKSSEDTRLLYCTTGVLLEKLVKSKTMANYTHVILDEVHERDQDMDFLFIVVRRYLATNSPHVKIILMSATIEAPIFANYFRLPKKNKIRPAPVITIEKKSMYNVREFYLDSLSKLNLDDIQVNFEEPGIEKEMYLLALKLCMICDRLDAQEELIEPLTVQPSILMFLPGIYEIERMHKELKQWQSICNSDSPKHLIVTLHSSVTIEEQQRAFRPAPPNNRKIILSTNIAESSITVPDVKYVIDFCLTKLLVTDSTTNFTSLKLQWASKNSCQQRAGRAGRVMNGRVYRLVPRHFYEELLPESTLPEILRSPLEHVVLKTKMLDMGSPQSILALALDQPKLSDIENTILLLKEVGALLKISNGIYSNHDGDITFIGRIMANLPVDIHVARLLIFGYCFSVLEDCIIISAGLTVKSIFNNTIYDLLKAYSAKLAWSDGSGSDLIAILKAYKSWCAKHQQGLFTDDQTENQWTRRYMLHIRSLKEMAVLVTELTQRLDRLGIKERAGVRRTTWTAAERSFILKVVIAGAFYPNYFLRSSCNEEFKDREAFRVLNGRDPCTTVYYTGFDPKYIGSLYTSTIKDLLRDCTSEPRNIHVSFDNNSQKVFVTFRQNSELYGVQEQQNIGCVESIPGRVATEVYKAVKKRKLNIPAKMQVMNSCDAVAMAEARDLGMWEMGAWVAKEKFIKNKEMICLPRMKIKNVIGEITQISSIDKFWFRPLEEDLFCKNIYDELNQINSDLEPFEMTDEIVCGYILAAKYNDSYYRARVEYCTKKSHLMFYKVFFIDIGNYAEIEFSLLRKFRGVSASFTDIPPRIFECRLAEIRPSSLSAHKNQWTTNAIKYFQSEAMHRNVKAEIYSVINGVANVHIKFDNRHLNEELIAEGFAQIAEENYMSKCNHELRVRQQVETNFHYAHGGTNDEDILNMMNIDDYLDVPPPPPTRCTIRLQLHGPLSPLESNVISAMHVDFHKSINIEPQSVNSVLLDAGQDSHENLLVACSISESSKGGVLTARQTTLMPNMPGFAPLMALIFCPYMEPLRDKIHSRYISILTGLGTNPNSGRAMFEEHDLLFFLDIAVADDDLKLINKIRFCMDSLLYTMKGEERPNISDSDCKSYKQKIKQFTIDLLSKERTLESVQQSQHKWGMMPKEDIRSQADVYGERTIFSAHKGLKLESEDSSKVVKYMGIMYTNCQELHRLATLESQFKRPIKCKLCEMEITTCSQLRIHLYSRLHRDREKFIQYS